MAWQVRRVQWDPQVAEVNVEEPVEPVLKVVKDLLGILVLPDLLAPRVLQAKRVNVDRPVVMVIKASLDQMVIRDLWVPLVKR